MAMLPFDDRRDAELEAAARRRGPEQCVARGVVEAVGRFRVHFNRHGAAPLVWCVATDAWELAVSEVRFQGVRITSVYRPKQTPDDEDGRPSAWFEVSGKLTL